MSSLKLAFRMLARTPFVSAIAIISLALGIGANAAMFSMFNQLLQRDVAAVPRPGELVNLEAPGPKPGSTSCNDTGPCEWVFSYPMFRDLERQQQVFTGIAGHSSFGVNLTYKKQTDNGQGVYVTGSYFPVLGVRPYLGRLLTPDDDQVVGAHPVAVLSYAYWATKLGADSSVVNTDILVRGHPMTIVGVAPPDFKGVTITNRPYVFIPMTMRSTMSPTTRRAYEDRTTYWMYAFARLKPGVSIDRARVALNERYHAIVNDVEAPLQKNMSDATMQRFRDKQLVLEPGRTGQSNMEGEARTPLLFLMATTAIVLLIACANIANLLLARAADRSTELAVRLSLGASRGQLVRQLLTESFVLASVGAVASIAVAYWTLGFVTTFLPPEATDSLQFTLQPAALWFTAALAVATGLVFGVFPAVHSTRPDLDAVLRAGSGKISGARAASRFRTTLATAQLALSMALLMMAGLFVKSLDKLSKADLGANVDPVVTFSVSPLLSGYSFDRTGQLITRIQQELSTLPGVSYASAASVALMAGNNWGRDVSVQGFERGPDTDAGSRYNEVGPNYFKTIGATLLGGREFTDADSRNAPRVAVVNETFARKFGLGRDAVGKFIGFGRTDTLNVQIVGLVKDIKYSEVKDPAPPVFYTPIVQDTTLGSATFYARATGNPDGAFASIRAMMQRIDPTLPVTEMWTMPEQVRQNVFVDRMIGTLSTMFAVLATLLAAVGLYGVLAYSVAQRTREIGVRMALGADRGAVRGMVLRQVGLMAAIGVPVGVAGALALARGARSLLFGIQGHDPVVMVAAVVTLVLVSVAAGYVPALRASRVDPMQALRYE
ncbi:MAG: ABC transporter permease [Gemmatimonadota bacterium]|nr:ABC transporter permease [Gemmatimonadota bacterium]